MQSNILTPSFSLVGLETVHGTIDPLPAPVQHVGVDHRRLYIPMPEEFLNGADIVAIFQRVANEWRSVWQLAGLVSPMLRAASLTASLEHRFVQMMSPVPRTSGPG